MLLPYAYNRCDAAGMVPKRLSAQLKREGRGPVGAAAYARMVNASPYSNHVSFVFPRVNRGLNVFPEELAKLPHACQACDFKYHHVTADGVFVREEGVVWFKMVSDSAVVYHLHDLMPREGKYMCEQCSNALQVPLFHVLPADYHACEPRGAAGRVGDARPQPPRYSGGDQEAAAAAQDRPGRCERQGGWRVSVQERALRQAAVHHRGRRKPPHGCKSRGGEPAALPHCDQAQGQARRPALRRSRPAHWRSPAALKEARPPQC